MATAKTENNKNTVTTVTPPPIAEKRKTRFTRRYEMSTIFYAFDHSRNLYYIFSTFDHKLQEILVLLNHRVFQTGVEK